ncbi:MAG TPA: DUF2784 domain-containing protein [Gemmatimonadaceae bacterium]|jgi:hypothetical protein
MAYRLLADAVIVFHAAFVAFVVIGGLVVLRWPWMAWLHLPAAAWGALIEFSGWICPLTPLENALRARAGESGYSGGFIEHYVLHTLYPDGLTRRVQWVLGVFVIAINAGAYALVLSRRRRLRPI